MCAICPSCGYDLEKDEPITWAGLSMFPYGNARVGSSEVRLTRGESALLWSLLKAHGRPLSRVILAERIGYEGDSPDNIVNVLLSRIKQKLAPHGCAPIKSQRSSGVYIEA